MDEGITGVKSESESFSAEEFVARLLEVGSILACDESDEAFRKSGKGTPDFYDEEKFERGKKFFYRFMHKMFLGKLLGLVIILTVPTIESVLEFTKMSGTPLLAYRRYLSTIFHMIIWYKEDFKPNSKAWKSLEEIRAMHNSASKRCGGKLTHGISQMDMALTQFGFMGFHVARSEKLSIVNYTDEEMGDFIHFWRIIGHIMGIHDRFNICRDSVQETRDICEELIAKVFRPRLKENSTTFVALSKPLIEGMWCMQPLLRYDVVCEKLNDLLTPRDEQVTSSLYDSFTLGDKIIYYMFKADMFVYKYSVFRYLQNGVMIVSLWLMKNFPFLGIYKFGRGNSYVSIMSDERSHKSG